MVLFNFHHHDFVCLFLAPQEEALWNGRHACFPGRFREPTPTNDGPENPRVRPRIIRHQYELVAALPIERWRVVVAPDHV